MVKILSSELPLTTFMAAVVYQLLCAHNICLFQFLFFMIFIFFCIFSFFLFDSNISHRLFVNCPGQRCHHCSPQHTGNPSNKESSDPVLNSNFLHDNKNGGSCFQLESSFYNISWLGDSWCQYPCANAATKFFQLCVAIGVCSGNSLKVLQNKLSKNISR